MTFNISAVAACCSRASFRSLLGPETERRLTRVTAGAIRSLVLVGLAALCWACVAGFRLARLAARSRWPRHIRPQGQEGHLIGLNRPSGRVGLGRIARCQLAKLMSAKVDCVAKVPNGTAAGSAERERAKIAGRCSLFL